jgi:hypothetical protein
VVGPVGATQAAQNVRARKSADIRITDRSYSELTRSQPIRTVAEMPIEFALTETGGPFAYQAIAKEALALRRLGMSAVAIARALGVTDKTVS